MGMSDTTIKRRCSSCIKEDYCEQKGICCVGYKSLEDKMKDMNMTKEEYKRFAKEWNVTRLIVRKKLRYAAG